MKKKQKTVKLPISINPEDLEIIKSIADLIGINGVYGEYAKVIKFSIHLTNSAIRNPEKVYISLNDENLNIYFQTIKNHEIIRRNHEKAKELLKEDLKV